MFNGIVAGLDKIAGSVESKGLLKEAEDIDLVSNTLERLAKELPAGKDRPAAIFPKEHPKVNDGKDHFPIPDKSHGQNALARVNQYSAAPSWWSGSLEELKNMVYKAVNNKFPGMDIEATDLVPGNRIPFAPNDPPADIAPPKDIDAVFPYRTIIWKFSRDNTFLLVLSKESFNKESLQRIINHTNFEKISPIDTTGTVFYFKNTYRNQPK